MLRVGAFLRLVKADKVNPFLIQPVILLADLDEQAAVQQQAKTGVVVAGYQRCKLIDLRWLFKQGSGNIPQIGQYLTRLALKTPVDKPAVARDSSESKSDFTDWFSSRAYFLDTLGLTENASRLMIFIFGTGGGTGAGMSPELGAAQQFLTFQRAVEHVKRGGSGDSKDQLEPSFSLGLGIMPATLPGGKKEAQSLNTGRTVVSYLARLQRYRVLNLENPVISELDLPSYNCLLLISNGIMAAASANQQGSFEDATDKANVYIAQQIFNLLIAQSLPNDYLNATFPSGSEQRNSLSGIMAAGGIGQNELVRLDPSDLRNSLYGVALCAYAEVSKSKDFNISDLVLRAVSAPRWNDDTKTVDGISVLPLEHNAYDELVKPNAQGGASEVFGRLAELPIFSQAISVVSILGVPNAAALQESTVSDFRNVVRKLFPNAKVLRYAVIPDSSEDFSVGFMICGSGFMASEVLRHIYGYALNCFSKQDARKQFIQEVEAYVKQETADRTVLEGMIRSAEDITQIMATLPGVGPLIQKKISLEARAADILGKGTFSFDNVLLSSRDMLDAIEYIKDYMAYEGTEDTAEPTIHLRRISKAAGI